MIYCSETVLRPMQIVLVDDNRSSLRQMELALTALDGTTQICFSDSAEALEWCLDHEPDLILVDYQMPRPDGLEFIEHLRRTAGRADALVVMVTGTDAAHVRHRALTAGATEFLCKPIDEAELLIRARNLLNLRRSQLQMARRADTLADEVRRATHELREREGEAIRCLARAAEHRDPETGAHLMRMAAYSRMIAETMGLSAEQCDLIYAAAPMHDVGKIAVPDTVLLKPGPLNADELAIMRQHPVWGHQILSEGASALLRTAAQIALSHHERWDGAGYPHQVRGDAIPLSGRIVALADVFDALTSERPYKTAWSISDALAYVCDETGRHFDPTCVAALLARENDVAAIVVGLNN